MAATQGRSFAPSALSIDTEQQRKFGFLLHRHAWLRQSPPSASSRISASSSSSSFSPSKQNRGRSFALARKDFPTLSETAAAPPIRKVYGSFNENKGLLVIVGATILGVALLIKLMKPKDQMSGSVEDLIRRGQLRSDRRSDSRPLKYEDPFNNPMVRVGEKDVKMYGKSFRLEPVTLTDEKRQSHQYRRVQAYQWKRPTVFLVEGEPIPEGIDPDTVRWIPSNHPFASTKSDFDEAAAEKNVYQTRGVPSRVRAEHEALRKKMLEASGKEVGFESAQFEPSMPNIERNKVDKPPSQTPFDPLRNGNVFGSGPRPIKPFEKPDSGASDRVQENPPSSFR